MVLLMLHGGQISGVRGCTGLQVLLLLLEVVACSREAFSSFSSYMRSCADLGLLLLTLLSSYSEAITGPHAWQSDLNGTFSWQEEKLNRFQSMNKDISTEHL